MIVLEEMPTKDYADDTEAGHQANKILTEDGAWRANIREASPREMRHDQGAAELEDLFLNLALNESDANGELALHSPHSEW